MSSERASPTGADNLVLRQLQGLRREFAAVLENQRRDRELMVRLDRHMEERFGRLDEDLKGVRRDVGDLRSDVVLLENGLITRQNEILDILRRLDDAEIDELPPDTPAGDDG